MKNIYILLLILSLTSCVEGVVVGSVATGVVVLKDQSLGSTKDDVVIESKIMKDFVLAGLKNPLNQVSVTVFEQKVLLTGLINNADTAQEAVDICWKVEGVKEVIDEIQVVENKPFYKNMISYFADSSLTSEIIARLLFKKNISSVDIKVITVNDVVYLIGTAESEDKIRLITSIAARTVGVDKVISHITIKKS